MSKYFQDPVDIADEKNSTEPKVEGISLNDESVQQNPVNPINSSSSPSPIINNNYGFIAPHVQDTESPIVVFVGPAASGKSMILVRLAQWLFSEGYRIETDETFLATTGYKQSCSEFNKKFHTDVALDGTADFLLVSVRDKAGNKIAQLLEAPGGHYFDPENPRKQMPAYLNEIIGSANKKVFVFLLDLDSSYSLRNDPRLRSEYASRLTDSIYPLINKRRDRIVLLYNKIDRTPFGDNNECHNPSGALKDAKQYYGRVFNSLKKPILGGFFHIENFEFMTFCTGLYSTQSDEQGNEFQSYTPASNDYPEKLWKEIMRKF